MNYIVYLQINAVVAGANAHVIDARHFAYVVDMRCKVCNKKINSNFPHANGSLCFIYCVCVGVCVFSVFAADFFLQPTHNIVQRGLSRAADKVRIKRNHNQAAVNGLQSNKPH